MGMADNRVASLPLAGASRRMWEYEVRHRLVQFLASLVPTHDTQGSSSAVQHGSLRFMRSLYQKLRRKFENISAEAMVSLCQLKRDSIQRGFL